MTPFKRVRAHTGVGCSCWSHGPWWMVGPSPAAPNTVSPWKSDLCPPSHSQGVHGDGHSCSLRITRIRPDCYMGLFFWQKHLFLAMLLVLHSFQGLTFIFHMSVSKCKFEILQTRVGFCSYKLYSLLQAKKVDTIYNIQAAKMKSQVKQRHAAWSLSKHICWFGWHSTSSSKNLVDLYFTFKKPWAAQKPNRRKCWGESYKQGWVQVRKK